MFDDYQLMWFAVSGVLIAIVFILQGQRLAELEVFGRAIIPLLFIYTALILYPRDIPAKWIHIFGAALIFFTLIIILIDFAFVLMGSIKNSFRKMRNVFAYERTLGRTMPDYIVEICRAMDVLASQGLGALVVIERRDNLRGFVKGGVAFDAQVKAEILTALFEKKSSVHDGAILVRGGRIAKVKAVLPVDTDKILPESAGLRHRSAVGITEHTDAIAFVASEQLRELSIAYRGNIVRAGSQKELLRLAGMALKRKNIYNRAQSKKVRQVILLSVIFFINIGNPSLAREEMPRKDSPKGIWVTAFSDRRVLYSKSAERVKGLGLDIGHFCRFCQKSRPDPKLL